MCRFKSDQITHASQRGSAITRIYAARDFIYACKMGKTEVQVSAGQEAKRVFSSKVLHDFSLFTESLVSSSDCARLFRLETAQTVSILWLRLVDRGNESSIRQRVLIYLISESLKLRQLTKE